MEPIPYAVRIRSARRDSVSVLMDTLTVIGSGKFIGPTNIMFATKTSTAMLYKRLERIEDLDLAKAVLIRDDGRRKVGYTLTERGQKAIRVWSELCELIAR
jgi:predicted transcriptional regulator